MTKATKKPTAKKATTKKASAKNPAPKKTTAKKHATKAVKPSTVPNAAPRPKAKPTTGGEHVKVAEIVMPTGRIRKRAVWGVTERDGKRIGEVDVRGKRFQVEQAGNQWKVVKELAAAAA